MLSEITNLPANFISAGLNPNYHELWWLEGLNLPNSFRQGKNFFLCSQEGKCATHSRDSNTFFFDSAVADDNKVYPYMLLWWQTVNGSRSHEFLNLTAKDKPSLTFDALLGRVRPNRMFAWDWLTQRPEISQHGYITYYGKNKDFHLDFEQPMENVTASNVRSAGEGSLPWSMIIPTEIYKNTWVTVVAETNSWPRGWSHFTEKIAKPILCGRPFIVLANPGYLKRLKTLGFVTFDNIIDESYDNVEDDKIRWQLALEQLKVFIDCDYSLTINKIQDQLTHNKQVMLQDWMEIFEKHLKELI